MKKKIINEDSNIIDLLITLIQQMKNKIDNLQKEKTIKNIVIVKIPYIDYFSIWTKALNEEKFREELITIGIKDSKIFIQNL